MNKKPSMFEKIGNFMTGKGFYLVVLVCVAAIALSGFYLIRSVRSNSTGEEDQPVSGTADVAVVSPSPAVTVTPSPEIISSPEPDSSPSVSPSPAVSETPAVTVSPDPQPDPSPSASSAALVFTWPVKGSVLTGYSVEALAYDPTMGDWRTHSGIDIASAAGTEVMATAAGTVSSIYEDDLLGTTVVIDHGNGLISTYSNLAALPTVKAGDRVYTGTVIGSVGKTASAESGLNSHLHFALFQDDMAVDPLDYLPER